MIAGPWASYAPRLRAVLLWLEEDDHLCVRPPDSARYVQVLRYGDMFRAEVVSNRYLRGADQWTLEDEAILRRLGWNAPGDGTHQGPNWHLDLGVALVDDVVELVLRTFRHVHLVRRPQILEISPPVVSNLPA